MGPVHYVNEIMDQHKYIGILENILEPCADKDLPITRKLVAMILNTGRSLCRLVYPPKLYMLLIGHEVVLTLTHRKSMG